LLRVARNTMQEQVYSQLRENLSDGRFRPGQTLTIRELAEQLGTSVMPVREALHKLTVEQVLDMTAGRSVQVPALGVTEFQEICESRMLMEGHLGALAAERADSADLDRIDEANEQFISARATQDPTLTLRRNREFHFAIYAAAHNPTLFKLVEPLWVRCGPSMLGLFEGLGPTHIRRVASKTHQTIVDGLRTRNATAARRAIVDDIQATSAVYRKHLEKTAAKARK
jgi:DNA-binding GntR family transcriptional regulator